MLNLKQQDALTRHIEGEVHWDEPTRRLYATDASVYRELPLCVVIPKNVADLKQCIRFAHRHGLTLIPRTAGTSLAGQCVGKGIVLDISPYFNQILELNVQEQWVRVQPGVVRDDLNRYLRPHGLHFSPNTSTANRAMIGGMVGNNSCGSYSIVYGDTRRHVLAIKAVLSDATEVNFGKLSVEEFRQKCVGNTLENQIYRQLNFELSHPEKQREIREQYPSPRVTRRNTGYAVDELLQCRPFSINGQDFNLCRLLAGSEGTLALFSEITLHLDPLPPAYPVLVCAHFAKLEEALHASVVAMQHAPFAVELMDDVILECTQANIEQRQNRFFVEGTPAAILCVEFAAHTHPDAMQQAHDFISNLQKSGLGYAFPIVQGNYIKRVWELRSAGLGLLSNLKGDAKPVAVVEDTAVAVEDLPAYIAEFSGLMERSGQKSVYYAHAGAGELHLRPILNLKDANDRRAFRAIGEASAHLVKKYGGSLSGEHGDGRVRGEFIPILIGEKNYQLLRRIKQTWDKTGVFNAGKITDAPPMDTDLRYEEGQTNPDIATVLDFSSSGGMMRAIERCNGSGDCRKSAAAGGTMCPSYMASRKERDTTRARANLLREMLTANDQQRKVNVFDSQAVKEILDLCLSCKGCASECPSNVDMAALKAEFMHQYQLLHGVPARSRWIANIGKINKIASAAPRIYNFFSQNNFFSSIVKKQLGIAPKRSFPTLNQQTLRHWYKKNAPALRQKYAPKKGAVLLFADEFTNYNDASIGIAGVELLFALGYDVQIPEHAESGRAHLSKGLLDEARIFAQQNVQIFYEQVFGRNNSRALPVIGIEPSAILGFRDEFVKLLRGEAQDKAQRLAEHTYMLESFLEREAQIGNISPDDFWDEERQLLLHGHCHQKALLSSAASSAFALSLPRHYAVSLIPSGCCGMAGSFGYESEHYELSMAIGELVLFPAVRSAAEKTILVAPGTSCRHQIKDGTGKQSRHPAEVLWEAVKRK